MVWSTFVITKVSSVRIGNSRGVRIPKGFLEQAGLRNEIEEVRGSQVVIRPAHHARAGWDESFAAMVARSNDKLLLEQPGLSKWDESEWEW